MTLATNRTSLSVLMAVYSREKPAFLAQCLESIAAQTLPADQVVVVKDGPLTPELEAVLAEFAARLPLETPALKENRGTGAAVQMGMECCTGDLIARADSDDVYAPTRFEKQVEFLCSHPEIDIVSASGAEFETDPARPVCFRQAPLSGRSLARYARFRNPITYQSTVIYRRAPALKAGSYQSCAYFEDYDLWARMMLNGSLIFNMPEILAYIRCGNGMLNRRRGFAYVRHEMAFLNKMYRIGFLSPGQYCLNVVSRVPLRLLPAGMLGSVYRTFLRKPIHAANSNLL